MTDDAPSPPVRIALPVALLAAAVPLLIGATAPPKPRRIMSLMLCNDLMLLALVPKQRIASITHLAHRPAAALMPGADTGIAVNHGTAEDILLHKPDLILAGTYSTPVARRLAARVGARLIEIGPVNSFADIRAMTRRIGDAVGERARADAMIGRMNRTLAELAATRPRQAVAVAAWAVGGRVPGPGTLTDAVIRVAGGRNVAARLDETRFATISTEQLLAAKPQALLQGEDRFDAPSLAARAVAHPLLRRLYRDRTIAYPDALYACGLPQTADAARDLRRALLTIPPGPAW